ncbi:MAG: SUMF1/EgtB/PvdO family nonheme iron enzyme [Anaerolineae bacterium]
MYERYMRRLAMSPDELEAHLCETFPGQRKTEPQFWRDPRFNNPSQPVVGICWHEARAYCRWLGDQGGAPFRLLSEVRREAAARGKAARRLAYGDDFTAWRSNTMEAHLRQVAPIGIFPDGDTPEGAADMAGNVYTWTSTAWGADPASSAFPYPYDAADGREAADTAPDVQRIIRGGSWYDDWPTSLAYARMNAYASDQRRVRGVGVRVGLSTTDRRVGLERTSPATASTEDGELAGPTN